MVDARLLRREAELLLSDGAARASTMVVHPHAAALDGLTAGSAQAQAAFEAEEEEEGGGSGGAVVPLDDAALDALADATMADRARNRWLEKVHPNPNPNPKVVPSFEVHPKPSPSPNPHQVMPSFDVQPLPFYPFFLATQGLEYQTMPWFSIQLIRRAELAEAREEWCRTLGMSQEGQHGQSAPLGSAPARLLRLLRARLAALGSLALPGRGLTTGCPATASGAQASCLQSRPFHRL